MQRGDLQTTPLADLLSQLADATATGCVYLLPSSSRSDSDESMVGLRNGAIWNVTVPGAEESIAARLVSSRRLSPTSLAEAREAQNTELSNWMLADLLIHLGLAEEGEVHELVTERALSDLADLCQWQAGIWRFRRQQRWGANLRSPLTVDDALAAVSRRRDEWRDLLPVIRGADGIVSLAAHPVSDAADPAEHADEPVEMDADGFALLCMVDGEKTLAELGAAAGFTLLDAGRTVAKLVDAGLVQVTLDSALDPPDLDALTVAQDDSTADFDANERHSLDAIAAALTFDDSWLTSGASSNLAPVGAPWQAPRTSNGDPLTDALARVSAALSEAMTGQEEEASDDAVLAVDETVEVIESGPVSAPLYLVQDPAAEEVAAQEDARAEQVGVDDVIAEEVGVEEVVLGDLAEAAALDDLAELSAAGSVDEGESAEELLSIDEDADIDGLAAFASSAADDESFDAADSVELLDLPMIEVEPEPVFEPTFLSQVPAEVTMAQVSMAEIAEEPAPVGPEPEFVAATPAQPVRPRSEASHHDMADASRLLSQLAGEALPAQAAPAPEPVEPEPAAADGAPVDYAPRPRRENGLADTAALLRELSSLGTETAASTPQAPNRPQPVPAPASGQHARKRKGLFGRS